ncbi:MAG: hypothetical protein RI909_1463 [Bacteroidota bacterium]
MTTNFERYAAKGNEFLNKLTVHLGDVENRDRAGRILRSVLRALRNRLTIQESLQLLSQLPMAIKSIYVDGWKLSHEYARIKTIEDFCTEVMKEDGLSAWRDFSTMEETMKAVEAVMKTLADYVTAGELHDVIDQMPQEIKRHFMVWVHTP